MAVLEVRKADRDRFSTQAGWVDSHHSLSFGHHFDEENAHHGLLLVNNDDIVLSGTGFDTHPHRDMEIVTWVLDGSLVHQDSQGNSGVIYPGLAQRMSAGTGILHSEKNDAWPLNVGDRHEDPVHFIQMWVVPDEDGITPGYKQLEIEHDLLSGGLVTVASGMTKHEVTRRSGSRTVMPRSPPRASSPVARSSFPTPRSSTSTSPAGRLTSRARAGSMLATRCASPRPVASA
jgi:quercetin 2,3-dioxygenase